MFTEMPNCPGFFLVENGILDTRVDEAIAILYADTAIKVKLKVAKSILDQEFKWPVFFALWTNPKATRIDDLNLIEYKFWFTNSEDYAMALLIG